MDFANYPLLILYCSIKKVISELVDLDISKVIRNSIEMNLIDEILATVAVQITLAHTLKELNLLPDHLIGFGTGELVAAYLDNYLTLKQTILALFYLASASVNKRNNKEDLKNLETVLSSNSKTWEKWIPVHAEKFSNCRKYFEDNFNEVPNEITLKKLIPGDAFTLIIGSTITSFHDNASYLINFDSKNHILDFFTNLGR